MLIHYPNKTSVRADYLIYVANSLRLFSLRLFLAATCFAKLYHERDLKSKAGGYS